MKSFYILAFSIGLHFNSNNFQPYEIMLWIIGWWALLTFGFDDDYWT